MNGLMNRLMYQDWIYEWINVLGVMNWWIDYCNRRIELMNGLIYLEDWINEWINISGGVHLWMDKCLTRIEQIQYTWIYVLGGLNFWIDKFIKRIEFMNELCIRRIELINGIMYLED